MPIAIKYALYKNSDSEWLGEIPSSWPMVLLSQIVTQVKNKNSTLSEKNLLSLSYGRIKRKPIDTSGGLLPASFDDYNIIEANDIVLRLTDLQNDHTSLRVGLSQERGIITSAYTTMRPKNSRGAKYLYYLLHTFDIRKGFYGMGSGVRQGLNYDEVKRLKLPLPTEEEQIAIAEFLDRKIAYIDSVIAEAKASIEEYKRWKQSIIDEAILGYDDIHIKLRQLGTLKNGINFSHSEATPNIKFLGVGCFKDSMVLDSIDNFADEHIDFTVGDDYLLHDGDIVFVRSNGSKELVGRSVLIENITYPLAFSGFCIRFRNMRQALTDNLYLLYYFRTSHFKQALLKYSNDSTNINNLNQEMLNAILIDAPPKERQLRIIETLTQRINAIDCVIMEKKSLLTDLEDYKKSLIFEVVTGKRRVC